MLLQPYFGIGHATPVVIALVGYAQLLAGSQRPGRASTEVPEESLEAARGPGLRPVCSWCCGSRLPLALPAIMAGLRVTTVSTIALLTIGGVIEQGGLGR